MTTPDYSGFTGFDGSRISGAARDFVSLDRRDGVERFETHFRQQGQQQATQLAKELCNTLLVNIDRPLLDLDEALRVFRPNAPAQRAYAEGMCAQLAYHADALRGIVALRDLGLPASAIADGRLAPVSATDMPNHQCVKLAEQFDDISGRLSQHAGVDLPARLHQRQWSAERAADDAAGFASPPTPPTVANRRSQPGNAGTGMRGRPGTPGGRHDGSNHSSRRGFGRS
jgi:hypothetical protein